MNSREWIRTLKEAHQYIVKRLILTKRGAYKSINAERMYMILMLMIHFQFAFRKFINKTSMELCN